MQPLQVAIAGGSIGGLTVACLLRDAGHYVDVFERSPNELQDRGAGIGFLEASSRYLGTRAGVDLDEISVTTELIRYLDRNGGVLHEQRHRYRFSSWTTVYRELLRAFERDRYHLGREMKGWTDDGGGVSVVFGHGDSIEADLLICADGVGSVSRSKLQPEASANYAGYVCWRGLVPERDLPPAAAKRLTEAITYYVFANSHFLAYPIPGLDGSTAPGDRQINVVWYRNYSKGGDLDDLLTDSEGEHRQLSVPPGLVALHHVAEARAAAAARLPADLADLVQGTDALFLQAIYDIKVERMAFGRVCLLGDAAFVARPHAAAGTSKAAEDSWVLATSLSEASDLETALARWETKQMTLGRSLVERTRRIGQRSQVDNSWVPGDPEFLFGLHRPGDL